MGRELGNFNYSFNYEVQKKAPLDARLLVTSKSDLIDIEYSYLGMLIGVFGFNEGISNPDNGVYMLKIDEPSNIDNWVKIASLDDVYTVSEIDEIISSIDISGVTGDLDDLLTNEKTTLVSAINEIHEELTSAISGGLTKINSGNGIEVSNVIDNTQTVSVKIKDGDKILESNIDGISANVSLSYENGVIKLIGKSGAELGSANIGLTSVIKDIKYDGKTEEIVITFDKVGGSSETVRIPLSSLIEEWDVAKTESITLEKQRNVDGKDILTANVNIDSQENNALKTLENGLFVNDLSFAISDLGNELRSDIGRINTEMEDLTLSVNDLSTSLSGVSDSVNELETRVNTNENTIIDLISNGVNIGNDTITSLSDLFNKYNENSSDIINLINEISDVTAEINLINDPENGILNTSKLYVDNKTGDLTKLNTENKIDLVSAINEVKSNLTIIDGGLI